MEIEYLCVEIVNVCSEWLYIIGFNEGWEVVGGFVVDDFIK